MCTPTDTHRIRCLTRTSDSAVLQRHLSQPIPCTAVRQGYKGARSGPATNLRVARSETFRSREVWPEWQESPPHLASSLEDFGTAQRRTPHPMRVAGALPHCWQRVQSSLADQRETSAATARAALANVEHGTSAAGEPGVVPWSVSKTRRGGSRAPRAQRRAHRPLARPKRRATGLTGLTEAHRVSQHAVVAPVCQRAVGLAEAAPYLGVLRRSRCH